MIEAIEGDFEAKKTEFLKVVIEYKADAEREIERRRKLGIPDISDIDPHPDDLLVDMATGSEHSASLNRTKYFFTIISFAAMIASGVAPKAVGPPQRSYPLGLVLEACPDIADYARNGIRTVWGDPAPFAHSPRAWLQGDRRRGFGRAAAQRIGGGLLQLLCGGHGEAAVAHS
jgi:hypothetical protein